MTADPHGSIQLQQDGSFRYRTTRVEAKLPNNTEELRHRYQIMARAWEYVRIRLPTKWFLVDYSMSAFDDLAEWLLGVGVFRREVRSPDKSFIYRPPWALMLDFEMAVRKKVAKSVNAYSLGVF